MKKMNSIVVGLLLTCLIVALTFATGFATQDIMPDSSQIINGINTGGQIIGAVAPAQYSGLIVALTGIISTITSFVIALLHRRKKLDNLKKDGLLLDRKPN